MRNVPRSLLRRWQIVVTMRFVAKSTSHASGLILLHTHTSDEDILRPQDVAIGRGRVIESRRRARRTDKRPRLLRVCVLGRYTGDCCGPVNRIDRAGTVAEPVQKDCRAKAARHRDKSDGENDNYAYIVVWPDVSSSKKKRQCDSAESDIRVRA